MFKAVNWERHGEVQSSAVPFGHALPLADLLVFGVVLQAITVPGVGSQIQRTTDSTAIFGLGNRREVVPMWPVSAPQGSKFPQWPISIQYGLWCQMRSITYNQIWTTNYPKLALELLSHTLSVVAGITEVACGGFDLYHSSILVMPWPLTHSGHCAVNLAITIPTSAHELQDTESDTMDEVDRDKLNKVGQATTPTHGTLGLDSNGLWLGTW